MAIQIGKKQFDKTEDAVKYIQQVHGWTETVAGRYVAAIERLQKGERPRVGVTPEKK